MKLIVKKLDTFKNNGNNLDMKSPQYVNIFNYEDPVSYLEALVKSFQNNQQHFSIRKWAKSLGLNTPDVLISILKRKKNITMNLVEVLCASLMLDSTEKKYFEVMVKYSQCQSTQDKEILKLVLTELSQLKGNVKIVEDNSVFSHWVHMAILSLCRLPDVVCNKSTISTSLLNQVPDSIINESIERLLKLGLVEYDENENLTRNEHFTTSKNDVFSKSPHQYFKQVSELAIIGSDLPANEREFQCFSLPIHDSQIPLFKEMLRNFRGKVSAMSLNQPCNQVYQFNFQFFPLTKKLEAKNEAEIIEQQDYKSYQP